MTMTFLKGCLDYICKSSIAVTEMEEYDYVPKELIHLIQSFLPPKDAARTCVLSKSWLHAWSTINTLRFVTPGQLTIQKQIDDYINCIDRTLLRYHNQNMSVECFHLHLDGIHNSSLLLYPLENWFQALAAFTNSTLKELSLTMSGVKFVKNIYERAYLTLPDAIFSYENLDMLSLRADDIRADDIQTSICLVRVNASSVIRCSFLRVLELYYVCITEEALHNLLSSCSLLEKINIEFGIFVRLKMIKVTNLRCLRELKINLLKNDLLEMYDLPSLHLFSYSSGSMYTIRMDTLRSVRELVLLRLMVLDDAFSDIIKTKFPFLETLTLEIKYCVLETINITCVSLKRLTLSIYLDKQLNIQVYASKLLYFSYNGWKMATLLFPSGTPAHIQLILRFLKNHPIDLSFFLKVRQALDLSSNFDIETIDDFVPSNINLDDLRRMVPFPARNVQQLSFGRAIKLWKQHSPLLDFLFSICYPRYVKAYYRSSNSKNYLYKQMVGMMYKKACNLKDIEIKNPHDGKWESLTYSWRIYHHDGKSESLTYPWRSYHFPFELPDKGNHYNSDEFKLNWLFDLNAVFKVQSFDLMFKFF